ncbi:MAG: cobalamin-binding protein [candidate division Zixibacteria bacterium HGW-Zixibacteria-1]|nr:MAG: cobalamin-binding protein [candidate division Zixibacteria bacterium HGW-Zixibacteria-1]
MEILKHISESLERGEDKKVAELTVQAIEAKLAAKQILDDGLITGMTVVGKKFKAHEIFLPDVLLAAKAMYAGLDLLKPLLLKEKVPTIGKVVIGTVHGDMHDIGKNLVGIMLKGNGFDIIDLGHDVPPEKFVDTAVAEGASVIGMSALLTTTMPNMKLVVDLIKERGLQSKIKTIIGGAPVSDDFAREIGADAYAFDGINSIEKIKNMLGLN